MSDFNYELPEELIAQVPLQDRTGSRLMVLDRANQTITHETFNSLSSHLRAGDLLVVNDSRVLPARVIGKRQTGGEVEFLLLSEVAPARWRCLMRPARKLRIGEVVEVERRNGDSESSFITVVEKEEDGQGIVELAAGIAGDLASFGRVPLPPYIHAHLDDDERYQTVYSRVQGSAAAPTAGLHFTDEVLAGLKEAGIGVAAVTLHVGLDTFRPVTVEYAEEHRIHSEWCSVEQEAARSIAETRERGGRVIAVGTTAARTLESYAQRPEAASGEPFAGMTDIYITPGYEWKMVDAMITNFHLPKSTLLLMLSSFAGKEFLFEAYWEAIDERYRFFSFGDAMFVF
jgi:S-adenosylmethionine:tRNA ribosyltransferase-isomerase